MVKKSRSSEQIIRDIKDAIDGNEPPFILAMVL